MRNGFLFMGRLTMEPKIGETVTIRFRTAAKNVDEVYLISGPLREKMSFEKADSIITEGMGTQFDSSLKKYYDAARPKLEEFYTNCE